MGEMLKSNKTLREIDLSYNALGQYRRRDTYQKGLTALCNGLKMNSRVANLNLSGNLLGNRGAILVAEVLRNNKTLVTLELERNEIENARATHPGRCSQIASNVEFSQSRWEYHQTTRERERGRLGAS